MSGAIEKNRIDGCLTCVGVYVTCWDNRLGMQIEVHVCVPDIEFSGWHEYDPGVRYNQDGGGDPPTESIEAEFCGFKEDLLVGVVDALVYENDHGRFTLIESIESIGLSVGTAVEHAISDSVDQYIVER